MRIFVSLIFILALLVILNFSTGYINSRIRQKRKRDKKLKEFENEGYKISKRWDCNAITIFSDKKKRVLSFLVMAWRKDTIYDIPIDSIKEITIGSVGIVKKSKMRTLITQIYLNIETEQGTYVLRTLYVKGIGLRKSSPHVAYAQKCAEEIRDYVYSLKD